jgi:F-type H+-transporting ATPase subunit epsilon
MPGTFNLQIVTPEREIFNGPVESVTVPGMQSSFGVLRNHAPLISALEPGLVDIYDADAREIRIAIGGGFFQVARNQAMVLADSAEIASEIDVERAREAERRARSRLTGRMEPETEMQRERAEAALRRAQARLRIATGG